MTLSDEDRTEIKAIIRDKLESDRKARMWRTSFLVGVIVMPLAFVYLLQKFGSPTTSLGWGDLLMVSMGIGWLAILAIRVGIGLAGWIFFSGRNISPS